jgi:hypothetical protein
VCRYVSGYWARNEGDVHAARHQSPLVRATSHRAQRRESHICGKNRLEKVYISASASDYVCVPKKCQDLSSVSSHFRVHVRRGAVLSQRPPGDKIRVRRAYTR